MEQQLSLPPAYRNQTVEDCLLNLNTELSDYCTIQAKHDALKKESTNEAVFRITILAYIRNKVQQAINETKKTLLIASNEFSARERNAEAEKQIAFKQAHCTQYRVRLAGLERKKAIHTPTRKSASQHWLTLAALVIGLCDGALAFDSFRQGGYSTVLTAGLSLGIAMFTALVPKIGVPWIARVANHRQRTLQTVLVLVAAFFVFYALGSIRATGMNSHIDITIPADGSNNAVQTVSAWPIALVSYGLFTVLFLATLLFWKNNEDKQKQRECRDIEKEIAKTRQAIDTLQAEIAATEQGIIAQRHAVMQLCEYGKNAMQQAMDSGISALALYKQTFVAYANTVPECFNEDPGFSYDTSIDFFDTKNEANAH